MSRRREVVGFFVCLVFWLGAVPVTAQLAGSGSQFTLGIGDVLQLNVLQHSDLDSRLTIRDDGSVVIPRVGAVPLIGLTLREGEELIGHKLRLLDSTIESLTLTVLEYNSLRIAVLGSVANPGFYSFTTTPSVWEAIRTAGGPTATANLSMVRVIREQPAGSRAVSLDFSGVLSGEGDLPNVPLGSGDTVLIPVTENTNQTPPTGGIQVFGSVRTPGIVPISEPTRLVSVLMLAGSPISQGKIDEVWWVHGEGPGAYRSSKVNLKLFLEKGSLAGNPLVYPGDTVRVPESRPGWFKEALDVVLKTATGAAAVIIAADRIRN